MEIINGELVVTYTDNSSSNLGSVDSGSEIDNTSGLIFVPLNDNTYGVKVGTALQNAQITIPAEYKGKTVTTIMEHGFENCSSLESITLPDSIISIQDYAFKGCTKLNISTLPSNLSQYW